MKRKFVFFLLAVITLILPACVPRPAQKVTSMTATTLIPTNIFVSVATPTTTNTLSPTITPTYTSTPLPVVTPWGIRRVIPLDGNWEMVKVDSLDKPIPTRGWRVERVPGLISGYNYERAWFQRSFDVPKDWQGMKVILHFDGVKYNCRVLVNGQHVGSYFNGYDAFEIEITNAIKWGETNLLQVGVHDWTGVFSSSGIDLRPFADDLEGLRVAPEDRILSPIGGLFAEYGIWDSVALKVVPPVHINQIFIRPSLRQKSLNVDVVVENGGKEPFTGDLQGRIFPWSGRGRDKDGQWILEGEMVASFPKLNVNIKPGETQTYTLSLDDPPLKTWSPNKPSLYIMEIGFEGSKADSIRERFGWREFYIHKGDFYLNGKKIHMLGASYWPSTRRWSRSRTEIASELHALRSANVVVFRTHTQPWRKIWYEVADEVGLMMIPEGAIWNDDISYRINDDRFWKNYADHLKAMVQNLWNHPSIVMWSLENELTGGRINDATPAAEKKLAEIGLLVKKLDPTRPITFESDGDPGGVTDVIGLHYPNEYPDYRLWPQDAYWLDKPRFLISGGGFFWDKQPFIWDRRKPLYIGEYMWAPSNDPATHTVMIGDRAYINYENYRTLAKAFAWPMQILAYRFFGVSGQCPWEIGERGLNDSSPLYVATRDMYRPLAAFLKEYDSRFYSGETITRTVWLFNDTMTDQPKVTFEWALLENENAIAKGSQVIAMASGEKMTRTLRLALPDVENSKTLILRLTLRVEDEERFRNDYPLKIYPRQWTLPNISFALYDPKKEITDTLDDVGLRFKLLNGVEDWNGQDILIIGPKALSSTDIQASPERDLPIIGLDQAMVLAITDKVKMGGRVLVLEQSGDVAMNILPVKLTAQQSTMAFIQAASHPVLIGLADEDFRWWRGDNLVSINEPLRGKEAGIHPLIVTGGKAGISHAPLVEVHQGNGVWLICQLLVGSKFENEPIAALLLMRMLHYLHQYQPPNGKILYYPANWDTSRLGADWQPLRNMNELRFPEVRLLVIHEETEGIPAAPLKAYVEAGGNILIDQPANNTNTLLKLLGVNILVRPNRVPVRRAEGTIKLLDFLIREDLYWIGRRGRQIWHASEVVPNTNFTFSAITGLQAEALTTPSAAITFPLGKGYITLSAIDWDNAEQNSLRGQRYLAGLLTGLGVPYSGSGAPVIIQAESFTPMPNYKYFDNKSEMAMMYANGYIQTKLYVAQGGEYKIGIAGYGTSVGNIYPTIRVEMDGKLLGMITLTGNHDIHYIFSQVSHGKHTLRIYFVNDAYSPATGEDRNAWIDYVEFELVR